MWGRCRGWSRPLYASLRQLCTSTSLHNQCTSAEYMATKLNCISPLSCYGYWAGCIYSIWQLLKLDSHPTHAHSITYYGSGTMDHPDKYVNKLVKRRKVIAGVS